VTTAGESAQFPLVLGLDIFGDVTNDHAGRPLSHAQTIRNLVEQGVLADQLGVDFFGIGEHHTDDSPLSAADVVLSAIAARTTRIHLGSAVTVLSSDDPVRVFQGFLFAELLKGGPVTWQGKTRASLHDQDVVPHTESGPFPAWIGVGGSPQSVIRAAHYGFSLMLAIIGGPPARFAPFSEREIGPHGALYVGSPETVAQKIAANLPTLRATRFDLKYGMGGLSHQALMTNIELYGTQVIPRVRELLTDDH
jgi:alkanesulfonate monooxygenase SsuD/methylene tetrahydromethanopterin reductase-like flavin-dependent oxidoreductase (luciferase family)